MIFLWKKLVPVLLILALSKVRTSNSKKNGISQSDNDESTENTLSYRLPNDIVPREYFIHLTPHLDPSNFTFDGTVQIIAEVNKSTSKIVLHSKNLKIVRVNVSKKNKVGSMETLKVHEVSDRKKYEFLIIRLSQPINAGTSVQIKILYSGEINTDVYGLFRNWYKTEDGSIKWMFATHLQPSGARRLFPCFDEPALKAVFHVSLDVPKNYTALGNMPIKSNKGGRVTFEKTPRMSTYLLALGIGDFAHVSTRAKNVSYSVWSSPPVSGQLSFALSVAPTVVDFMESHLNISYGLRKMDLLVMSDYKQNAMENWGLIIQNDIMTLYDSAQTSLGDQKTARNYIAHEISHQWFGNLVTTRWWDSLWLNEAFASYFEYHAHDDSFTPWNLETDFVVSYMEDGFGVDEYNNTHPLTNAVYSSSEVQKMFDWTSYKKGASLIRMLEKLLGSKIFYGALRRYLLKNKFSTGNPESLFAAFDQEIKSNRYNLNMTIDKLMNSWTLQAGHPVIDAQFNEGSVTLTQSRFFIRVNSSDESLWVVPINWATRSDPNFKDTNKVTWLTQKSTTVPLNRTQTDWVIFNIQETGFYRVNYDKKMWKRITKALKSKEFEIIHEINRASLIDDLFNLGRSGFLDYDTVLTASQYLPQETNYFPWRTAFSGLIYLKKRFTGHSKIMGYFKNYVGSLTRKNYQRLGFREKENDSVLDKSLRELTLKMLCFIDHAECVRKSLGTFKKVQRNESFTMSPNLRTVVYCTAVRHGPPEYWDHLAEKAEKTNYASERAAILYGLSCSKNSSQLENLLQKTIKHKSGIRIQDTKKLFESIAANSAVGVQTLMNFTEANSDKIIDYFSSEETISQICGSIADVVSTKKLFTKFKEFVENIEKKTSVDDSYVEKAETDLNWYKSNAPTILQWFKANYPKRSFLSYSDI